MRRTVLHVESDCTKTKKACHIAFHARPEATRIEKGCPSANNARQECLPMSLSPQAVIFQPKATSQVPLERAKFTLLSECKHSAKLITTVSRYAPAQSAAEEARTKRVDSVSSVIPEPFPPSTFQIFLGKNAASLRAHKQPYVFFSSSSLFVFLVLLFLQRLHQMRAMRCRKICPTQRIVQLHHV